MKKINMILFLLPVLFTALSCVPSKVGNYTEVKTTGIQSAQEAFSIVGGNNRGQFLIGGQAVTITAQLNNTSNYTYKNISLFIDPLSNASVKFQPYANGTSSSPGLGGTCKAELPAGQSCTYTFQFIPTNMGELTQTLTLTYINLLEPIKKTLQLSFLVGDYPNVIEVNEAIRHDFGTIERMDKDKYYDKVIVLQNVGGLKARGMTFSMSNLVEGAYIIAKNTCPADLPSKAKCEVTVRVRPQNYLITDTPKTYNSELTVEYFKNSENSSVIEKGRFLYNLTVFSTKVEGILAVSGVSGFAFPKLVHGNKAEVDLKIKNNGMKGLILRKLYVYGSDGNPKGVCGRIDNTGKMSCVSMALAPLPLLTFPFSFKDTNNCLVDANLGDYTRDSFGLYSYQPKFVMPATDTTPGDICTFKVTFHSSILNTADTNFSNWAIGFEFDNTFQNTKEIVTTTPFLGAHFTVTSAHAILPAVLKVTAYGYGTTTTNNPPSPFLLNAGRVALLQSTSTYTDAVKFSLKNTNTNAPLKIKTIETQTDAAGTSFFFNNSARTINDYFSAAFLSSNCTFNVAFTTAQCDLQFKFSPKSPYSDVKLLGADAQAQGKTARDFIITYNNGCSINDDGTPCANKTLVVSFQAAPIVRGNLQYDSVTSGASGALPIKYNVGTTFISGKPLVGSNTWYYLWLENIGTGSIPYLKTMVGSGFKTPNASLPFPFVIVPDATGLAPGQSDCYDYFRGTPDLNDDLPVALTPKIDFPPATKCRLKVESMFYPNEMVNSYGNYEWRREFYVSRANNREYIYQSAPSTNLALEFYDNDVTSPTPTTAFVPNFGERLTILGGSSGRYTFKSAFAFYGKVTPVRPTPIISAVLYRPAFTLPAVAKHPNSQMAALGFQNIAAHVFNNESYSGATYSNWISGNNIVVPVAAGYTALPAVGTREFFTYLNNLYPFTNYATYDYVFHAGSFPAQTGQDYYASMTLENTGYGNVTNLTVGLTCESSPQGCGTGNTIALGPELILSTLAAQTGTTLINMKINPSSALDVGLHEAMLTINFKNPDPQVLRIKVLFDITANNKKTISVTATDYECNFQTDLPCAAPTVSGAPTNITSQFLYNRLPNTMTKMIAVAGSPIGVRKKLTITNTGTESITNLKVFLKDTTSSPLAKYTNALGIKVIPQPQPASAVLNADQFQCQSAGPGNIGVLLSGDSCTVDITYQPISASNLPQILGIGYRQVDGAGVTGPYINQYLDLYFMGDNQANLVIDGKPTKSFPPNIAAYPIKFNKFIESNHPVLTVFPKTTFDSVPLITNPPIELVNQRPEKASLLKQYEDYANANGLPLTPPVQAWTRIYQSADSEIAVEANQGCFYGADYSNGAIPADKKGFYSNDQGTSYGCKLRVLYSVGIDKRGTINSQNSIIPLKYYSSRRLTTKTVYLYLEGFVEPYRSMNATTNISNVSTDSSGTVRFSWDNFTDETAPHGNIHHYRVYYSKFGSDLVKMYDSPVPNTLMYVDTTGTDPNIEITGLEASRYYFFQIVAMRRTAMGDPTTEYISMPDSLYRKKILVPPAGFAFDYASSNLVERSLYPLTGDKVIRSDAQTYCVAKKVDIKDESITTSKTLELISSEVYNDLIYAEKDTLINDGGNPANLAFSDHNFLATATWVSDITDITGEFTPGYDCNLPIGFNADTTASYIKSCDNNNPDTLCCSVNILGQIRGLPLPSAPTVERLYTNLGTIKAQYRCFVKLTP